MCLTCLILTLEFKSHIIECTVSYFLLCLFGLFLIKHALKDTEAGFLMFWLYFSTVTRLNVGDGNKMEETTLKTAEHDEMIEADLKLCGFLIILPPFLDTPPLRHFLVYFLRSVKPPLSGKMAAPIVVVRNRHFVYRGQVCWRSATARVWQESCECALQ